MIKKISRAYKTLEPPEILRMKLKNKIARLRNAYLYGLHDLKARLSNKALATDPTQKFVVSIASYPGRIHQMPAIFQALSKQTVKPRTFILVLAEEDWPGQKLPAYVVKLQKRGVEIIWTRNNPYAVKKLTPVLDRYPELAVVTLDDDFIYHPQLLEWLVNSEEAQNGHIVGHYGKVLYQRNGELGMFYRDKKAADQTSSAAQVFLIGWAGIYYPPTSLDPKVKDLEAINRIVPGRGSDIWFWAAAHAAGTEQQCLGYSKKVNLGIPIPKKNKTRPLDTPGGEQLESRFHKSIDHFGVRAKLKSILPEQKV